MSENYTEIPFGFTGRIFRSAMPFGGRDRSGEMIDRYQDNKISTIVVLAEYEECIRKSGKDLIKFYKEKGYNVIHSPIVDFGTPSEDSLRDAIEATIKCAQEGENTAVHCSAGIGRTGLFMACLAKKVFEFDGIDAIRWVREYIDGAVETSEQVDFIKRFK